MTPKHFEENLHHARESFARHYNPAIFDEAMKTGNPFDNNNPARLGQVMFTFLLQCLHAFGLDFPEPKRGPTHDPRPKLGQSSPAPKQPSDPGLTQADIATLSAE